MRQWIKAISFLLGAMMLLHICSPIIYADPTSEMPDVVATTAVVMDAGTGMVLYDKSKDLTMYPASITKMMTALLAIEDLDPEDTITFSENAIYNYESNTSHIGIRVGETLTVDQALHGLLLMSANEVAMGIAEKHSGSVEAFAQDMNAKATSIGALNSQFLNPHGLHDANHYTTAYDMALITKEMLKYPYFLEIMGHTTYEIPPTNMSDEIRYLSQQHKMLNEYKDLSIYREDVIAGKSGYTYESGHTLITVADVYGRQVIVVILDTDANHLYSDTASLIDYAYEVIGSKSNAFSTGELLSQVSRDCVTEAEHLKDLSVKRMYLEAVNPVTEVVDTTPELSLELETDLADKETKASGGISLIKVLLLVVIIGGLLVLDQKISMYKRKKRTQERRRKYRELQE